MTAARMETAAGGLAPAVRTQHWQALTATHKPGAWEALDAGYSESHRAYHSWEHIDDMLEKLEYVCCLPCRSISTSRAFPGSCVKSASRSTPSAVDWSD